LIEVCPSLHLSCGGQHKAPSWNHPDTEPIGNLTLDLPSVRKNFLFIVVTQSVVFLL
jgi:hypothetical protein